MSVPEGARAELADLRALRWEIEEFNADYAAVLDAGRIADWPGFFTQDAIYRITGRENWDAKLPVGLVYCEGMGMLRDRALAIAKTTMFAPRYHFLGWGVVRSARAGALVLILVRVYLLFFPAP